MSAEDIEALARMGEAFDAHGWDGVLAFAHEDFEFHEPPEQPGATVFRGHEEARAGFARWAETWVEQRSELQGLQVLPDGRILAFTRERLLGRDGVRVETDSGQLFTMRDGKVLRWQVFWDLGNARAAAGISG